MDLAVHQEIAPKSDTRRKAQEIPERAVGLAVVENRVHGCSQVSLCPVAKDNGLSQAGGIFA